MPELPEVETVRRTLAPILGARVTGVSAHRVALHMGRRIDPAALRRASAGAVVDRVDRWGKYLLWYFAGRDTGVLVHLGMTGRLRVVPPGAPRDPHTHAVWTLADGRTVRFSDPRRFGLVDVFGRGAERAHPSLAPLGIDALDGPLTGRALARLAAGSGQAIKALLLDQRKIAGIGNIYACEALWRARIAPALPARELDGERAGRLARAVRAALRAALDHGGTSLRDFVNAAGNPGSYRDHLRIYGRAGRRCPRRGCRGTIVRTAIQGRATFHCPTCQAT
ncbi:MAG: bifunctional DNA-formamidopyrimidine glycosylase/DNA-(apurinic or apyrimidinic site) lyase [Deltaproteobacteria bacterium]|nr:MAG: bifunctional DNA-formamidopyrimidine glycosylase/DNA-(apurinic or apyrimidinic site) lyase [Deltaproteobacteria bacterium]